jgi:putative effector of murein hydrolase LrgA (UPF0299 family)
MEFLELAASIIGFAIVALMVLLAAAVLAVKWVSFLAKHLL